MSFIPDVESDCNCLFHYQNELGNVPSPNYITDRMLPTINYVNERKCPVWVYKMRYDSNVCNSYDEWFVTRTQKNAAEPKPLRRSHKNHKSVLDKLEETYWATWKPKMSVLPKPKLKFILTNMENCWDFSDTKTIFQQPKVMRQHGFNKPAVDVNDNVTKYFKFKRFETSSSDTMNQEEFSRNSSESCEETGNKKMTRLGNPCRMSVYRQYSIFQESQTDMHGLVVLRESKDQILDEKTEIAPAIEQDLHQGNIKAKHRKNKGKLKATENEAEPYSRLQPFGRCKDSTEVIKKQEQERAKEHLEQHKCIRLYRKSGTYSGYIKGGTYTLRSCLKNEGSFRLGPPGSTLFISYS